VSIKDAAGLAAGDRFRTRGTVVKVLRDAEEGVEEVQPLAGLPCIRVYGMREDTGKQGWMNFGLQAGVDLIDPPQQRVPYAGKSMIKAVRYVAAHPGAKKHEVARSISDWHGAGQRSVSRAVEKGLIRQQLHGRVTSLTVTDLGRAMLGPEPPQGARPDVWRPIWVSVSSHRARHVLERTVGRRTPEYGVWTETGPRGEYHCVPRRHAKALKGIKGITVLARRPKGEIFRRWE
jgi:hypothetical protein